MRIRVNHDEGQYRAELFERVIFRLLPHVYPHSTVIHDFIVPKGEEKSSLTVDFVVKTADGKTIAIETKAPYTDTASYGINRTIRRLKFAYERFSDFERPTEVIVALASDLPAASTAEVEDSKRFFTAKGVQFRVWDAARISHLLATHLQVQLHSFSAENLAKVLSALATDETELVRKKVGATGPRHGWPEGEQENVVVMVADFCSYTKFVAASGGDKVLISSVMGRFYRQTRDIVRQHGGTIDKYMGDGLLAFWLDSQNAPSANTIDRCCAQLIGTSLDIAEEWQDQVDAAVEPIGMRVGAAVGKVLFVKEHPGQTSAIHAIGDSINLAARLQAAAKENSLVISNKLKKALFDGDGTFHEMDQLELKNVGKVVAWTKDYEEGRGKT